MEIKRLLLASTLFIVSLLGLQAQYAPTLDHICEISCLEQKGKTLLVNGIQKSIVPPNYDLKWHQLYLEVDPAVVYLTGSVTSLLTPTTTGVNEIYFDCSDSLIVDSVYFEGSPVSFSRPGNDGLQITLGQTMNIGTNYTVVVYYQGVPPNDGFDGFFQDYHNGTPIIWTLSEPYSSRSWWPCKQSLNDKFDSVDVIVKTPFIYRAASNGILVSETQVGADKVYHWKHRYPNPAYLISIAVTNYVYYYEFSPYSPTDSITILNYVYPEELGQSQIESQRIKEIFPVFNQKFGLYPYHTEKYGHARFERGGGMEHTTMSSMGSFAFELMAHELAHQWFGNMVTCKTWEDIWINEGFASYLTGLVYEELWPDLYWPIWKNNNHDYIISQPDGSVKVDDTTNVNRIFDGRLTYSKGAYVLHILRWVVGDANFYTAVNNFLYDPALQWGYASTQDLKNHMEAVYGQDLTYFFDDWYSGEGYPVFDIFWNQDASNVVGIQFNQTPSDPSVSFFEVPVPVRFYGNNGQDTTFVYDLQANGEWFFSQLDFQVDSFKVDPDKWILSSTNSISLGVENENETTVNIFPNPASSLVSFVLPGQTHANFMEITDFRGRVCYSQSLSGVHSWNTDIRSLANGTYIVRIETDKGSLRRKLIKK